MTTAKDLFIIAMDLKHSVGQGDLSLALAGAELIDLIGAGVVTVDGDRIVPGGQPTLEDRFMGEAAAGLTLQAPYERIEDWMWRRGRDLSAAYQAVMEENDELKPQFGRRVDQDARAAIALDHGPDARTFVARVRRSAHGAIAAELRNAKARSGSEKGELHGTGLSSRAVRRGIPPLNGQGRDPSPDGS